MTKIIIADVLYTVTDEIIYVLNRLHENAPKYYYETSEDVSSKLETDGWRRCGKVNKSDYSLVDILTNHKGYITVWGE